MLTHLPASSDNAASRANSFAGLVILIPAYNPDNALTGLVDELIRQGAANIVIVDDGSPPSCRSVFDKVEAHAAVHLCGHSINRGKGAALKTGLQFIQQLPNQPIGVITADADGQHLPEDVRKLADASAHKPDGVLLGSREFGKETPLRSLLGNRITALMMAFTHGIRLTDTQTGLRYLPSTLLPHLIPLSGERYEFELQCLISAKNAGYSIDPVPVSSIYINDNASSHFLPIMDSVRIYGILLRFGSSSVLCFGIDILLFGLIFWSGGNAMLATVIARIISGVVNFSINKALVFSRAHSRNTFAEAMRYLALWLLLMLVSGTVVTAASERATWLVVLIKILVDISLFLFSYYAQSRFVFTANRGTKNIT